MKTPTRLLSLLVLALASSGNAQAVLLTDLLGGASITAGDKVFDNWTVFLNERSDANGVSAIDTDSIDVIALNDGGMNPGPGLRFNVSNGELSVTGDDLFAYVDFQFGFRASVLDPSKRIKDNSLNMGLAVLSGQLTDGDNDLGAYILENIGTNALGADLGTKSVEFSLLNDALTSTLSDTAAFAPQSSIWVTKNVYVWARDSTDTASLFDFEQRFSQTTVPEPATLALLGLGLAGLGFTRRRRQ